MDVTAQADPATDTLHGLDLTDLEAAVGNVRHAIDARKDDTPTLDQIASGGIEEPAAQTPNVQEPDLVEPASDDFEAELERELHLSAPDNPFIDGAEADQPRPPVEAAADAEAVQTSAHTIQDTSSDPSDAEEAPAEPSTDLAAAPAPEVLEHTMARDIDAVGAFEDSLKAALDRLGGTLLFDMRAAGDAERVAAVRIGEGDEKQFALVILPQGGGAVRVEPTSDSENPLAALAESYDGLMTALKIAA